MSDLVGNTEDRFLRTRLIYNLYHLDRSWLCIICLFDLVLYIHGKQLRSCRDSQLLNHTVLRQVSQRQFTSIFCIFFNILLPVTENLLFLNQWKREYFSSKECAGYEVLSRDCRLRGGHATDQATAPCLYNLSHMIRKPVFVVRFKPAYTQLPINESKHSRRNTVHI